MERSEIKPILTDEQGDWYCIRDISELMKRTPERIRQLTLTKNPPIIKDKSRGVILFRLADGWEFRVKGGIRERV